MSSFIKVATIAEFPIGSKIKVKPGRKELLVVHTEDGFFAVVNECTHQPLSMDNATIHKSEIICPHHAGRFDLKTGNPLAPPTIMPIDCFNVKVEGNDILVEIED